jgi:glycosyltransferase involved in cell wall biosynthesis
LRAQVVCTCDYDGGTLQHAVMLARALRQNGAQTRLVNLRGRVHGQVEVALCGSDVELISTTPDNVPDADLNIVVDLVEVPCREAARALLDRRKWVILVPTCYALDHPLPDLERPAEAVWYVSWDQASYCRAHWDMGRRVDVVRCAVDTDRFRPPAEGLPTGPWILSRHSRDSAEKFSPDLFLIFNKLGELFDVRLRMMGAVETLGRVPDDRVQCLSQGAFDVPSFLQESHLWFFSHAGYWRESACIAMLEAMACGLPVVVTNAGGMREYMVHGETGFLCNDTEEFVRCMRLLFDSPDLMAQMRAGACRYVEERRSFPVLCRRVAELLGL